MDDIQDFHSSLKKLFIRFDWLSLITKIRNFDEFFAEETHRFVARSAGKNR